MGRTIMVRVLGTVVVVCLPSFGGDGVCAANDGRHTSSSVARTLSIIVLRIALSPEELSGSPPAVQCASPRAPCGVRAHVRVGTTGKRPRSVQRTLCCSLGRNLPKRYATLVNVLTPDQRAIVVEGTLEAAQRDRAKTH